MIREATPADLARLAELECEAFPHSPWKAEQFLQYRCLVAELEGEVVGFLVSRETFARTRNNAAEREILNVAVASSARRKGVASALLEFELRQGARFFLEVRESNAPAQALYGACGFTEVARRPGYYDDPPETAIVMFTQTV